METLCPKVWRWWHTHTSYIYIYLLLDTFKDKRHVFFAERCFFSYLSLIDSIFPCMKQDWHAQQSWIMIRWCLICIAGGVAEKRVNHKRWTWRITHFYPPENCCIPPKIDGCKMKYMKCPLEKWSLLQGDMFVFWGAYPIFQKCIMVGWW